MPEYTITLNEAEVNAVLAALAQQPYYAVAELIDNIRTQCIGGENQCT